jgi:hypothetical protein
LEPGDKFAEVHHAREYNASFGWCQVPDNRPRMQREAAPHPALSPRAGRGYRAQRGG